MMREWRYKENSDREKIHPKIHPKIHQKIHPNIHQKNHHDQQKSPNNNLSISQSSKTAQPCQTLPNRPVLCPSHRWHPSFIIFACHVLEKPELCFSTKRTSPNSSNVGKKSAMRSATPMPRSVSSCRRTVPRTPELRLGI